MLALLPMPPTTFQPLPTSETTHTPIPSHPDNEHKEQKTKEKMAKEGKSPPLNPQIHLPTAPS